MSWVTRPTLGAHPFTASPGAPASPSIGDIWVNTATGQVESYAGGGRWTPDMVASARTLLVSADKGGHYQSVVTALAAITDAAAGNEYILLVQGAITETAQLVAKSYIHLIALGKAGLTVNLTSSNADRFSISGVVGCRWQGLKLVGGGTASGVSYALNLRGATDATFQLIDCDVSSAVATANSIALCVRDTAAPTMLNCSFTGGGDGSSTAGCFGADFNNGSPAPLATRCRFRGRNPGTNGARHAQQGAGVFDGCTWELDDGPTSQSAACLIQDAATPRIVNGRADGAKGNLANTYGFNVAGGSAPVFEHCVAGPGYSPAGVNFGVAWRMQESCSPHLVDCQSDIPGGPISWAYDSTNSGRFQPTTVTPFQLDSLALSVTNARANATLNIGTTAGGTDIATGILLSATGIVAVPLPPSALVVLAAGGYLYATPSGSGAGAVVSGDFTVYGKWSAAPGNQYGIYNVSTGRVRVRGGTYRGQYACVFNGDANADQFRVEGAALLGREAWPPNAYGYAVYSLSQTSPLKDAQVHGCALRGAVANTQVARGRRTGSNAQGGLALPARNPDDFVVLPPGADYGLLRALNLSTSVIPAVVTVLGDSIAQGLGLTSWADDSFVGQLKALLQAKYGDAGEFDPVANNTAFQAGYAGRTYWIVANPSATLNFQTLYGFGRIPTWSGAASYAVMPLLTFTYPYAVVDSTLLYADRVAGTFQYAVNGGAAVTVTNTAAGTLKALALGARSAGDVLTFGNQTADQVFAPNGMHLSRAAAGVYVGRNTYSGLTLRELYDNSYTPSDKLVLYQGNTNAAPPYNALALGSPSAPHCLIVALGVNDLASGYGLYRFRHGLARLCNAARRGKPDATLVLVGVASPDGTSSDFGTPHGSALLWPHALRAMRETAEVFNGIFVNVHAAYGETPVASGYLQSPGGVGNIHPLKAGHDRIHQMLARVLVPQ